MDGYGLNFWKTSKNFLDISESVWMVLVRFGLFCASEDFFWTIIRALLGTRRAFLVPRRAIPAPKRALWGLTKALLSARFFSGRQKSLSDAQNPFGLFWDRFSGNPLIVSGYVGVHLDGFGTHFLENV